MTSVLSQVLRAPAIDLANCASCLEDIAIFFRDVEDLCLSREHFIRAKSRLLQLEGYMDGCPYMLQAAWAKWLELGLERFRTIIEYYDNNRSMLTKFWLTRHLITHVDDEPGSNSIDWDDINTALHPDRLGEHYPLFLMRLTRLLEWAQRVNLDISVAEILRPDSQQFPFILPVLDWLEEFRVHRAEELADW